MKTIICDDHMLMRQGLKELLLKCQSCEIVAEASNGQEVVKLAKSLSPELILMDLAIPLLNGIEATRQILSFLPGTKIIALSMHADRRFVLNMFKAGAHGYILKDSAFEELLQAISAVMTGKTYVSPSIAHIIIDKAFLKKDSFDSSAFSALTERERQVLQLLTEGKNTKEVANMLKVSVKTIETFRKQIMDKLNIHNIAELTKYAIREGLTSID